jgi:hypothetical protein
MPHSSPHLPQSPTSYRIPSHGRILPHGYQTLLKQLFGNWSTDSIIYTRSAPPVNVVTGQNPFAGSVLSGASSVQRPDVVPGVPFYIYPSGAPGGKVINAATVLIHEIAPDDIDHLQETLRDLVREWIVL